jgi:hypothetical protein
VRLQCFFLLARCARGAAARAEAEERAEESERQAAKKHAELQLDYERRLALAKVRGRNKIVPKVVMLAFLNRVSDEFVCKLSFARSNLRGRVGRGGG